MKFKDVRTLESILVEYGMKQGASTPTSDQQTGATAKATATATPTGSPTIEPTAPTPDLGSPTITGIDVKEPDPKEQQPAFKKIKALDLDDGTEYKDDKGELQGTVISKVGRGPTPDKVVVMDPKGEYNIVDPEQEVHIDLDEGARAKQVHKKALNKIKPKHRSQMKKVKRLARLNLKEADEKLFEVNFNKKTVIEEALDSPIRCGFEAETLWSDIEGQSDDVDNYSISEIDDNFGGVDWDSLSEGFTDWIYENKIEEYMDDAVSDWVESNRDDYYQEFAEAENIEEYDWADKKEEILRGEFGDERYEKEPEECEEEYGYDDDNWLREYIDQERESDFESFLEDRAKDDDYVKEAAYEQASESYDYDDWINDAWYSMSSFCEDYGIEISGGSDLQEVANIMETWIETESAFHDHRPDTGGYGETSGDVTEYAVETDSSIDGSGTGAEIISPVFTKPRNMLNELNKFFDMVHDKGGSTNRSTGLHVTMSWDGERNGLPSAAEPMKAKMALLLGDKYLLQAFNRDGNSYAKSQYDNLKKATEKLKQNMNDQASFEQLEATLNDAISNDKFQAIHFKSQKDSQTGTNLIEFRIGGGEDYHLNFPKVSKAVIRYATSMRAGYDESSFKEDYIKAAFKLINKLDDISDRDKERVKNREDEGVSQEDIMVIDAVKTIVSADNYVETVTRMANVSSALQEWQKLSFKNADTNWKAKWQKFLSDTGKAPADYGDAEFAKLISEAPETFGKPMRGYVQPHLKPPSIRAVKEKEEAMDRLGVVLGQLSNDLITGTSRAKSNAKTIGSFRNFFKRYEITYEEIAEKVVDHSGAINMTGESITARKRITSIKQGLEQLLKKDIITLPEFLKNQDTEVLVNAIWGMFNADVDINKDIDNLINAISKMRPDMNRLDIESVINASKSKREFNDFYSSLLKGNYHNNAAPFENGIQYNPEGYKEALKIASKYPEYDEPVSTFYNQNIYSDDSYEDNFLSKYMMKLRQRLQTLDDLKDENTELYLKTTKSMSKPLEAYLKSVKSNAELEKDYEGEVTDRYSDYAIDKFVKGSEKIIAGIKSGSGEDTDGRSFGNASTHVVTDYIRNVLMNHYRAIQEKDPEQKKAWAEKGNVLDKKAFLQLKLLMESWDKIITKTLNYPSQQATIDHKQQVIQKRDDFKNQRAEKPAASVNVPFYSNVYITQSQWVDIKSSNVDEINPYVQKDVILGARNVNSNQKSFFVVPAVHYSQCEDALNGSSIVNVQMKAGNDSQAWRLPKYKATLKAFYKIYGVSYQDLIDKANYKELDGEDRGKISKLFKIEFTKDGDGREGQGDFDTLIPKDEMQNPKSGEPLSSSARTMWTMNTGDSAIKQFDAYDWTQRTPEFKAQVYKLVSNGETFNRAFETVQDLKNRQEDTVTNDLLRVAGVSGDNYREDSSAAIARDTDWTELAQHLLGEPGANEQSSNLLRNIFDSLNDDYTKYRMTDDRPIVGMDRYLLAVRDAKTHIETNYTLTDGNYVANNSDVSGSYDTSPTRGRDPEQEPEQSIADARDFYPAFDNMMRDGMQNFMRSGKPVNDLVGFLTNSGNTSAMKDAVLQAIQFNKEGGGVPLDYDSALTLGSNRIAVANESVFNKFDALPLQEQLDILNKSKILEGKTTLNPPSIDVGDEVKVGKFKNSKATVKGFTTDKNGQPVLKTNKGDKPLYKPRVSKLEPKTVKESVPVIKTIKILNDLLADHFPVGDLKKQMLAFQAIPIPSMLDQFRELRAEAGDDACARGIVRYYTTALPKEQQDQIDLREWTKSKINSLVESKGIMGRVLGDRFQKGDDVLEFQSVNLYPTEQMEFESPEQRDDLIQQLEQELNSQIEWTNVPNRGSLSFGIAVFTDPELDDKLTYWGRYFKQKTVDMMGKWSNSQVPQGWKLQTAGAMKLDIGIDPQHLIKTDAPFNGVLEVIQAVKSNSAGNELSESLVNALETIHTQEHPVFPGQITNLPALRDYFGEIMGPVALMSEMVGGQADAAKADLLKGLSWSECSIFWPMAMNAPLVDSYFTAPDGTRVGISSKGGKGAKASVKNIQDAILKAPDEMKAQYQTTVKVVDIVQSNSAKDGPIRLAELYRILPQGLEQEINGYIQAGKQDYAGLSPACTELFNYGTPRQDVPGFNTGYAMLALLAKKVTRAINTAGPEFGQGCVAFLNQSSIVQLYCKMGKNGQDARVTGWEAVYPPNFQGTVEIDGSKNYYSSRIGGKFAFGFK
jgi:hypothetical protein|tara:strand:- start:12973 stop:19659 length:6687 start_codon:yes stop_codon:yes gene_type:complete